MENTKKPAITHGPTFRAPSKTLRQRYRESNPGFTFSPSSGASEPTPVFGIGAWPDAWYFPFFPN